jgi:hypothetical protein
MKAVSQYNLSPEEKETLKKYLMKGIRSKKSFRAKIQHSKSRIKNILQLKGSEFFLNRKRQIELNIILIRIMRKFLEEGKI